MWYAITAVYAGVALAFGAFVYLRHAELIPAYPDAERRRAAQRQLLGETIALLLFGFIALGAALAIIDLTLPGSPLGVQDWYAAEADSRCAIGDNACDAIDPQDVR